MPVVMTIKEYHGAWELVQAFIFFTIAVWFSYTLWVHRKPGSFWQILTTPSGDRVIFGAIMMGTGQGLHQLYQFFISVYVYWAFRGGGIDPHAGYAYLLTTYHHASEFASTEALQKQHRLMQIVTIGYVWHVITGFLTCTGFFLWLNEPLKKLWGRHATPIILAYPALIFLIGLIGIMYGAPLVNGDT